jgi:formate dehydrogenase subunit delta
MTAFEHDATAKLLRMANQIAANYHAEPLDKAAVSIATHINKFWTPKMREDLIAAAPDGNFSPALQSALGSIKRKKAEVL